MNHPDKALTHIDRAAAKGDSPEIHLARGRAHLSMHYRGDRNPPAPLKGHMESALDNLKQALALAPANPDAALWLAQAHVADKKPETAISILKPFITQNPEMGATHMALAAVYEGMKKFPESVEVLESAAKIRNIRGFETSTLGRAYFLAGRYKEAIETWQKLVLEDKERTNAALNVGLAVALALNGQYEKALAHAETILHQTGTSSIGGIVAASIAIQAGRFDKAKEFLETRTYPSKKEKDAHLKFVELCRSSPGNTGKKAAALISEGTLHTEFRNTEAAIPQLQKAIELLPASIVPHYVLIDAMNRTGRTNDLAAAFKTIFKTFPSHGYPHFQFAALTWKQPGAPDQRQPLELALNLDPDLADAHTALAQILLDESQSAPRIDLLESAVKHATEAVNRDGGTMNSLSITASAHAFAAQYWRSEILKATDPADVRTKTEAARQSTDQAAKALRTLCDKFPNSLAVAKEEIQFELVERNYQRAADIAISMLRKPEWADNVELGILAASALSSQGKPAEALKQLSQLIEANPTSISLYRQLAKVHEQVQQPGRAIYALQRALAVEPGNPRIALELATACMRYGQPQNAKTVFESILAAIPSNHTDPGAVAIRKLALLGLAEALVASPAKDAAERDKNLAQATNHLKDLIEPAAGSGQKPDVRALMLAGRILEEQNQDTKAMEAYQKSAEIAPKYAPAWHAMTALYYRRAEYEKALEICTDKIIPAWPIDPGSHVRLALIYLARGTPGDAPKAGAAAAEVAAILNRSALAGAWSSQTLLTLYRTTNILALIANGKTAEARDQIRSFPNISPTTRESYSQLVDDSSTPTKRQTLALHQGSALFFTLARDIKRAVKACESASAAFPNNLYLLEQLANIHRQNGDPKNFALVLEQMLSATDSAPGAGGSAARTYHQQLYIDLIETYRIRLAQTMNNALPKAIELCERALTQWPGNLALLQRLAAIHADRKENDKAINVLTKIASLSAEGSEQWIEAKKLLALTKYQAGDPQAAMEFCDQIERYIASDAPWLNNSAWFHAIAPKPNIEKALELAQRAKELSPPNPEMRDTIGWIYHLAGKYAEAAPELEYAAQELHENPNVAYHLGANQIKNGNTEEGLKNLKRALDLHRQRPGLSDIEQCKALVEETEKQLEGHKTSLPDKTTP